MVKGLYLVRDCAQGDDQQLQLGERLYWVTEAPQKGLSRCGGLHPGRQHGWPQEHQ